MLFALGAMGLSALVLTGCGKKKEPPKADPSAPAVYMKDPEFRGKLAAERKEHQSLVRARNEIAEQMRTMVEAKKNELKTEDVQAVRAALEKDPAWRELYVQCTNANARVTAQRQKAYKVVRERIAPKKPVSK